MGEESLHIWFVTYLFPLTLPHLHYFNVTSKVCGVLLCIFQQHRHRLTIHRVCFILVVAFRTTVPKTPVELIGSTRLSTPPIHPTLANSLLATINLMADCASALSRFPSEPLDSHLPERLCLLWTELVFLPTTYVPSRRHVMHQRPQIQSVGIIPHYRSTRFFAPYLSDVLFVVSVKYDGRPTNDIFFDE